VEVGLGPADGIPRKSVTNADSIMTVPKDRLVGYLTALSPEKVEAVGRAIKFALDLP